MKGKSRYIDIFVREAEEHLASLQSGLLALEKAPGDKSLIHELLRNAHTLKGAARMLGFEDISSIGHGMEDLLTAMEEGAKAAEGVWLELLLKGTDAISRMVAAMVSGSDPQTDVNALLAAFENGEFPAEAMDKSEPVVSETMGDTVRTKVKTLDSLINRMGELIINKKRFEEKALHLKGLCDRAADPFLSASLREFHRDLEEDVRYLNYLVQELYGDAMAMRMLPLKTITDGFERMVRDLGREQGKVVELNVTGAYIEMDRVLLENLKPMLLHMLRNSVDHGIEPLDQRLLDGKPPKAAIEISARHEGNSVWIVVRDDGKGIDPKQVKDAAIAKGLMDMAQAEALTDEEALYLVLEPGFSTKEMITDISGRGVGMDVVKKNIEKVKGNLEVRSQVGIFTEISLQLPLTLSVMEALLVSCSGESYAIPLNYVQETLRIGGEEIETVGGKEVISIRGITAPLVSLASLLGLPEKKTFLAEGRVAAVVLKFRDQLIACTLDNSLGSSEIVVKGLGEQMKSVEFISGATILGDGDPALILNVPDIFARAEGIGGAALKRGLEESRAVRLKGRILVVDDSITTRTMERSILLTHGYQVEIAISGEDALEKVVREMFDLVVSDVEMPGINGFELTRRLRAMDEYAEVPVIIVSSLSRDADKRKAMEAGAQAYIVKGSFDQGALLDTVEALIG